MLKSLLKSSLEIFPSDVEEARANSDRSFVQTKRCTGAI